MSPLGKRAGCASHCSTRSQCRTARRVSDCRDCTCQFVNRYWPTWLEARVNQSRHCCVLCKDLCSEQYAQHLCTQELTMHITIQAKARMKKRRAMWKFLSDDSTETFLPPASGPAELSMGVKGSAGSRLLFWRASLLSTCNTRIQVCAYAVCHEHCIKVWVPTTTNRVQVLLAHSMTLQ